MKIQEKLNFPIVMALLTLLMLPKPAISANLTGEMVAAKSFNRDDGRTMQGQGMMTLVDSKGKKKILKFLMYSKDFGQRTKTLTRFTAPSDIAGTSFLNWDNDGADDQFLYLPALKRVRRIVSTQKDGQFVNSDITYEDLERREVNLDSHQLLQTVSNKKYKIIYVLKSVPKDPKKSQYSYRKSWVVKELDYLPIRGEFYDKRKKMVKTFEAKNIQKIDGVWTVTKSLFYDLKRKHQTLLVMDELKYNRPISNAYFTKTALESY